MRRKLLYINPRRQRFWLQALETTSLDKDPREEYLTLHGEALGQYVLRCDKDAVVIARGPLPFLPGNKATVAYVSPLTGVPHYSFVGGRAARELLNLGLDAIVLTNSPLPLGGEGPGVRGVYAVVTGHAPHIHVAFHDAADLPSGQRAAFYWLVDRELDGDVDAGSVFTLGDGARLGYRTANLAADAIYHAGRGGAGLAFARHATALVLRGQEVTPAQFFGDAARAAARAAGRNPTALIRERVDEVTARLSGETGGTIRKLFDTGGPGSEHPTLPARNATRLGTPSAHLGGPRVLATSRHGRTGCHWCPVDCRHWHWVPADYAPGGRDIFLDDFEPSYVIYAMLGLTPAEDSLEGQLALHRAVNEHLFLPIEQLGCDVIDVGVGLAALFEGVSRGLIPADDVPPSLRSTAFGDLDAAVEAVRILRAGETDGYPALRAVADGPQALAERYPGMADVVFTSGKGTLGNAGHANALWTFLMPCGRFFGHYVGQFYKIAGELPRDLADATTLFQRVVDEALRRERFGVLCNALSLCAFVFAAFGQGGQSVDLDGDLLVRVLAEYDIQTTRPDLEWFAGAFWAQSMDLKARCGWRPPTAGELPARVYEALSLALDRSPAELRALMAGLIAEWRRQAGAAMRLFGYQVEPWLGDSPWE